MTLAALVGSTLLIIAGLSRVPRTARRGPAYWWTWSTFGVQLIYLELVAAGFISALNETAGLIVIVPSMAVTIYLVGRAVLTRGFVNMGALLSVVPLVISVGYVLDGQSLGTPVQSLIALAVVVVLPSEGYAVNDIVRGLRDSILHASLVLLVFSVTVPALIGACRIDKCSIWGDQIGESGSANGLGMSIAFVGVVAAFQLPWWRTVLVLLGVVALTDLCSSRSALTLAAFGVLAVAIELVSNPRLRRVLRVAIMTAVTASIVTVALMPVSADSFTTRGSLWIAARALILERPLWGWGVSFWVRQSDTTALVPNYAAHNLLLELCVSFGLFGMVAAVMGLVLSRRSVRPYDLPFWHVCVTALLAGGIMEVLAAPGRQYLLAGAFILPFMIAKYGGRVDDNGPVSSTSASATPVSTTAAS